MIKKFTIKTTKRELIAITRHVEEIVKASGVTEGLCTIFIPHTSASLIIQENADPAVQHDIQTWMNRLFEAVSVKFTHVLEGSDDMPAHIKSALTCTSLSVPIISGHLALGAWQAVYLWEHRKTPHTREVIVHITG